MKWKSEQFEAYQNAKEYIDTAIIPLIPIDFGKADKETVMFGEFTHILSDSIEKQFTGRVFLMPSFTYLKSESIDERLKRLRDWDQHFYNNGFTYVTYITSDTEWKSIEKSLPDELIWLPALSSEEVDSNQFKQTIDQLVKQIMPLFTIRWQSEPCKR